MKRILLTGMSGTGKSTLILELKSRGYRALDMDESGWSEYAAGGEWVWQEARIHDFLSLEVKVTTFVSGCAVNQGKFYAYFDKIVLLSAPARILTERLTARTNNLYGKLPEELAATLHNLETVEPLLRQSADHEIDTSLPFVEVLAAVLRLANG